MRLVLSLFLIAHTGASYAQDGGVDPVMPEDQLIGILPQQDRAEGGMTVWAYQQVWTTLHDQDESAQADPASYGDPELDTGFSIRRARLGVQGWVPLGSESAENLQIDYALSVGVSSPYDALTEADSDIQLVDAYTRVVAPLSKQVFATSVGAQRVPFNRESLMASSALLFQERAVGSAWMTPGRSVGVLGTHKLSTGSEDSALLTQVGAYNGTPDLFGDDEDGMLLAGRVEWMKGRAYQSWDPDGDSALGLGLAGRLDEAAATRVMGLGADMLLRVAHFTLMAEVQQDRTEPTLTNVKRPAVPADTERLAYMAQLSRWVPIEGTSGLEVGGRFASFDDASAFDDAGDVWTAHGGVTWRNVWPFFDLGAGYIHRGEWFGPAQANDSVRLWMQVRGASR